MDARALLKACANGSSELMSNISSSLISVIYNLQLLRFAGENGVAAYGAGNSSELKNLLKKSLTIVSAGESS